VVPQTGQLAHRNNHYLGFIGFMNAYLLTGDDRYLDVWRKQADLINGQKKVVNGRETYPHMYGDKGWYNYTLQKYQHNALEMYLLTLRAEDRKRAPASDWLSYLDGKNPKYPETALLQDLARVRQRVEGMRKDQTTPDTRLADDPMRYNPASVGSLIQQTLGGVHPGRRGAMLLHSQLRYFDTVRRRAGLPEDVAALIERMDENSITLTLVNTNPLEARTAIVQAGGYGEHEFTSAALDGKAQAVKGRTLTVRLGPGAGGRLVLQMRRYVNVPRLAMPFED
jgi:hypothetical protein